MPPRDALARFPLTCSSLSPSGALAYGGRGSPATKQPIARRPCRHDDPSSIRGLATAMTVPIGGATSRNKRREQKRASRNTANAKSRGRDTVFGQQDGEKKRQRRVSSAWCVAWQTPAQIAIQRLPTSWMMPQRSVSQLLTIDDPSIAHH